MARNVAQLRAEAKMVLVRIGEPHGGPRPFLTGLPIRSAPSIVVAQAQARRCGRTLLFSLVEHRVIERKDRPRKAGGRHGRADDVVSLVPREAMKARDKGSLAPSA